MNENKPVGRVPSEVSVRDRLPRDLALMGSLVLAYFGIRFTMDLGFGVDSHAYWASWQGAMYKDGPAVRDAYLYSPAFAQAIWPLAQLPWPAFGVVISAVALGTLVHLVRPWEWYWSLPLLLASTHEVLTGNIFWLLAVVAVYGMRFPGLWAIAALTKITPAVGFIWFAVRREWHKLAWATLTTIAIVMLSWLTLPHEWAAWFNLLANHAGEATGTVGGTLLPPPIYRIPFAIGLVAWGAATTRRWTIPASMILASPVFGIGSIALLAALPRLSSGSAPACTARPHRPRGTPPAPW